MFAPVVGMRCGIRATAVAAVVALAVVGCGASGESDSEGAATAPETIRLGATLPLTGAESRAGGLFRQGYELAIRKKNAEGGIRLSKLGGARAKVELVLHDDRTDQRSVVSLTRRLIDRDQVDAMLGTYSTTLSSAQASAELRADQRVRRAYLGV